MQWTGYVYQCSAGETFDSVALGIFGSEKYACELLGANPDLSNISVFSGGETLLVPAVATEETDDSDMPSNAPWKE